MRLALIWAVVMLGMLRSMVSAAPATTQAAATIDVSVDPRVEMMSIIFYLANNPEYTPQDKSYRKDIDAHFAPVQQHAVVKLARSLRQSRGISYDAPMSLAVHLNNTRELKGLVPLDASPLPPGVDSRWRPQDITEFLADAKDFLRDSHFDDFLAAHKDYYATSCQRLRDTLDKGVNVAWFDGFFGKRADASFHVIIGAVNGPNNYGVRCVVNGREEMYCILGVWTFDEQGTPLFPSAFVPIVIHEFCHSFCNPLIDAYAQELDPIGAKLFTARQDVMKRQAYGNGHTVLYESLVRACVARCRFDNEGPAAEVAEVAAQRDCGFDWVADMTTALADYEQHRDKYPTLDTFMPRLARCLSDYAAKMAGADQ